MGKKTKKKKLTEKEKEQRQQKKEVRRLLTNIGFNRVPGISGKQFIYEGRTSEIDEIFLYENILLIVELTTTASPGEHLINKKLFYDKINASPVNFISFLLNEKAFEQFRIFYESPNRVHYSLNQIRVKILYCSRYPISQEHKNQLKEVCFFEYPVLKYFDSISSIVKRSSRYEFFSFLNIRYDQIGENILRSETGSNVKFSGHILPEEHSSFKEGYKIISFYIDAASLLQYAYVLRRDSWKSDSAISLYQRMFQVKKIKSMRKYLNDQGRVFINNIVTVLPTDKIKLYDQSGCQLQFDARGNFPSSNSTRVQPAEIQIDNETNIIGIVDGQHRLYAYHEGNDKYENIIKDLRKIQNLLVTGILYPEEESEAKRLKFEAELFLEINANQTSASSQLKQEIELTIHPFSSTAIAKSILNMLNESGPLENMFESHFYEKHKLKTASTISFALKPLIKFTGSDSLYQIWDNARKTELLETDDIDLLTNYKKFCAQEIRKIFIGIKDNVKSKTWDTIHFDTNGILSVTVVNGILNCLRLLIENEKHCDDIQYYREKFQGIDSFDFKTFKSSQYRKMGQAIYNTFFV